MTERTRRIVRRLVVVDLVVLGAVAIFWVLAQGSGDDRANVVNGELRGSKPPAGQTVPDLARVAGVEPRFPAPAKLRGRPLMIVGTCIDCRSGQVIGGFLGRLGADDIPDGVRVVVVGWDGDAATWRTEQHIPGAFEIHVARNAAATSAVQDGLEGITESGRAYLYDASGRWRSTFHLGQMDRDDVLHDLERLAKH
ncbi:MAG: hypothetical protein JWM98_1435 [Thermoleophilia bacterium]|nr:hypothetical protein [Thermoleophilia bacterium]